MAQQATASVTTSITVSDALLHYLTLEGVDHVFGIPGGGLANLLTAFKNHNNQFKYLSAAMKLVRRISRWILQGDGKDGLKIQWSDSTVSSSPGRLVIYRIHAVRFSFHSKRS